MYVCICICICIWCVLISETSTIYIYIYTLLTYKAYRYMITLLLCTNYLTVQIYNTE